MFHGVEPSDEMAKPSVNNLALAGLVGMKRFAKVSRTVLELRIEQGFSDEQFSVREIAKKLFISEQPVRQTYIGEKPERINESLLADIPDSPPVIDDLGL